MSMSMPINSPIKQEPRKITKTHELIRVIRAFSWLVLLQT